MKRSALPEIRILSQGDGSSALELLVPAGGILLESRDLEFWNRSAFHPAAIEPVIQPLESDAQPARFFRILPP